MKITQTAAPALTALALTGLCLTACQGAVAPGGPRPDAQVAGAVEAVRDGVTELRPGQSLRIALPSNSSTGYSWSVGAFDEAVLTRSQPFGQQATDAHPAGMVGVGGQTHWRFVAAAPGETTLTFGYGRPWEKDTAPTETARFTIRVH